MTASLRLLVAAVLTSWVSACATYSPPAPVPAPAARVEVGAVISSGPGGRARNVAALIERRGSFRAQAVVDLRGRLQELAGAARIPLRQAGALIDESLRRAGKLDGEGARAVLAEARALLPGVPVTAEETDTWAALQSAAAVLALLDGDPEGASRLLRSVSLVRPSFVPPSSLTPPEALALLRRAQVESDAAPRVAVEVQSTPAGAEILVDGTPRGRSPVRLELPPGTHFAGAAALGLRAQPRPVPIGNDATVVRLSLAPASTADCAADALLELDHVGADWVSPAGALALRLAAVALEVEHLALLDGSNALIWNAGTPATVIPVRQPRTVAGQSHQELATVIATRWESTPPAIDPSPGRATAFADSGQDTPWYRLWWGWVVAVLATGITLSIVR